MGWKRSVLENPDRQRTNQSTGICYIIMLNMLFNTLLTITPHRIRKKEEEEKKEQRMDLYDDIRGWSPIQFLTPTDRAYLECRYQTGFFARGIARHIFLVLISKIPVLGVLLIPSFYYTLGMSTGEC